MLCLPPPPLASDLNKRFKEVVAFTLIELSIVLVVIGLLVGGVLVGQDLIKAAELRQHITLKEQYVTAANTFRLKYNCLPGDCPNATDFFGTDPNGCPTPGSIFVTAANAVPKIETCNGDGNKRVFPINLGTGAAGIAERYRFWQQLASAGLIKSGLLTGTIAPAPDTVSTTAGFKVGLNMVDTGIKGSIFEIMNIGTSAGGNTSLFEDNLGHSFVGWHETLGGTSHLTPNFTTIDALSIDTKADDGLPGQGNVQVFDTTSTCVTNTDPALATYDLSVTDKACQIIFSRLF